MAKKINIKSLPLQKFLKIGAKVQEKVDAASDTKVPELTSYAPNKMAQQLHPAKQHLIITDVIDHNNGFKSFVFGPDAENGTEKLSYAAAGQYISFDLHIGNSFTTRPYSFSSSPKQSLEGKYIITIKKMPGGFTSSYIFDNWKTGTKVTASAPLELMTYESLRDAPVVVAAAGGSGITPFYSMAQAIKDGDETFDLILLYGSRSLEDAVFLKEMKEIEKECPHFKMINILSDEKVETAKQNPLSQTLGLTLEEGFITADIIKKYAPAGSEYSIFMCGPGAMYKAVEKECAKLGIKKRLIRYGAADECKNPKGYEDYPKEKAGTYSLTVRMHNKEQVISCSSDETLLVAMEKAGIAAPSQCRRGSCGWCRSRLAGGQVYIPAAFDKRRMGDKLYSYVHPCCTFPVSDVIIYLE